MRFLFDILHPAHVHVLRHPMALLQDEGHEIVVTARVKDVAADLLDEFGIDHTVISIQKTGSLGLASELVSRTYKLARIAKQNRVDALVGLMGPSIAPVGRLLRIPSFVLYDTEIAARTNRWVYPLATEVLTPACYSAPVNGTHVRYNAYHELFYLHPNRFTPDRETLHGFGIDSTRPYVVVRLPNFVSSHDGGEVHTPEDDWHRLINDLGRDRNVYVSSERPLPHDLRALELTGPVTEVHHILAYADLVIGESATMAAEAAVLGTPAVFIGVTSRGYIDDIERRYGLIRRFQPGQFDDALAQARHFLDDGPASGAASAIIDDHVDVTPWFVEHLLTQVEQDQRS